MNIADMFNDGKTVFSFEVFPPKKTSPIESIYDTLEELGKLKPDFISVTYGAAGNAANGVDGVHIYTMNNPYVARRIAEGEESIVRA